MSLITKNRFETECPSESGFESYDGCTYLNFSTGDVTHGSKSYGLYQQVCIAEFGHPWSCKKKKDPVKTQRAILRRLWEDYPDFSNMKFIFEGDDDEFVVLGFVAFAKIEVDKVNQIILKVFCTEAGDKHKCSMCTEDCDNPLVRYNCDTCKYGMLLLLCTLRDCPVSKLRGNEIVLVRIFSFLLSDQASPLFDCVHMSCGSRYFFEKQKRRKLQLSSQRML